MMHHTIGILTLACMFAGCTSTETRVDNRSLERPELSAASYKVVGPVSGTGESWGISPGIFNFVHPLAREAEQNAMGDAIFDKSNVDMIVAPKIRITHRSWFGLYVTVKAEVKGQGVQLIAEQVNSASTTPKN